MARRLACSGARMTCEDDTATDYGLGHARHHLCTIDHEFTTGMRNNGEISVYTLRHVGRHLNLELLALILVVIIHCLLGV